MVCEELALEGTQASSPEEALTVIPTYGECRETTFGTEVIVDSSHCGFRLSGGTNAKDRAPVDIECEAGHAIRWTMPGLGIDLTGGPQEDVTGVTYATVEQAGHDTVRMETHLRNLSVSCTEPYAEKSELCAFIGGGKIEYRGTEIIAGLQDEGNAGTVTTPEFTEGQQIDLIAE